MLITILCIPTGWWCSKNKHKHFLPHVVSATILVNCGVPSLFCTEAVLRGVTWGAWPLSSQRSAPTATKMKFLVSVFGQMG